MENNIKLSTDYIIKSLFEQKYYYNVLLRILDKI